MLIKRGGVHYTKDKNEPYSGPVFSLFENGKKESETRLKEGKLDGKLIEWYENGNKKYEQNFENGKKVKIITETINGVTTTKKIIEK